MSRTAATPHRAASAMEQRQIDIVAPAHLDQRLLSAILGPGGRQLAGILGRVRVADHHFLTVSRQFAIAGQGQQTVDDVARPIEIIESLEQRRDGQSGIAADFLHQQRHGEHVRRLCSIEMI